tara:strand:- start:290 stop:643 length:354 start_codon:yes stop_codon:yes gene_type:complete
VFLVICIFEYVFIENFKKGPELELKERELPNDYPCFANANVSFLVNIFSMGINFGFYSYLTGLDSATDQRWDQIMKVNLLNISVQSIGATMAGILVVKEQIAMFAECSDVVGTLYIR